MNNLSPAQNPPVTAAGAATVLTNLLAAFGSFTDQQIAALGGALFIALALIAQRFTTPKETP